MLIVNNIKALCDRVILVRKGVCDPMAIALTAAIGVAARTQI
jgi:ABC-type Na+ transport system ATPase subunit NatA